MFFKQKSTLKKNEQLNFHLPMAFSFGNNFWWWASISQYVILMAFSRNNVDEIDGQDTDLHKIYILINMPCKVRCKTSKAKWTNIF